MGVSFVRSGNVVTLLLLGSSYQLDDNHKNYHSVFEALKKGLSEQDVLDLLMADNHHEEKDKFKKSDVVGDVVSYIDGVLKVVVDGKEREVEQCLQDEMDSLDSDGLPVEGMMNFVRRLYGNTSMRVRKELLSFIKLNGLTIDSDGFILTYKAVTSDYKDKYTRTVDNSIGATPSMDRSEVDDNFDIGCSKGLHSGALEYVHTYGWKDDRIIIVKINPADVVSVPKYCEFKKIRCCKYTVVGDYNGKLAKSVYQAGDSAEKMYESDTRSDNSNKCDWKSIDDLDDEDFDDEDEDYDEDDFLDYCDDCDRCDGCYCDGCGYNEDEDEDDEDDECCNKIYKTKPSCSSQAGRRYYARRDNKGRFY